MKNTFDDQFLMGVSMEGLHNFIYVLNFCPYDCAHITAANNRQSEPFNGQVPNTAATG